MKIIKGDLIKLALEGEFDIIGHGCNCFCIQGAGIAFQMANVFHTSNYIYYSRESTNYRGNLGKLGNIQKQSGVTRITSNEANHKTSLCSIFKHKLPMDSSLYIDVYNMYTQYKPGKNLNYSALELCLMKLQYAAKQTENEIGKAVKIGLPWIGCGIAGGDKDRVKEIMESIMTDVNLTVVEYDK